MKYKANINEENNYNETPLYFALLREQMDIRKCYNLNYNETCGSDIQDYPETTSGIQINLARQNQGKATEILKYLKDNGAIAVKVPETWIDGNGDE